MMSEKSEIGIELISDNCKFCPCLELETIELMAQKHHRCKHLQMCRAVLAYWKNGDFLKDLETEAKKCPNNGTEEMVVDVFGHRYVKDADKQGWTGVEIK